MESPAASVTGRPIDIPDELLPFVSALSKQAHRYDTEN